MTTWNRYERMSADEIEQELLGDLREIQMRLEAEQADGVRDDSELAQDIQRDAGRNWLRAWPGGDE